MPNDLDVPTVAYATRARNRSLLHAVRAWFLGPPRVWQVGAAGIIFVVVGYAASFPYGWLQLMVRGGIAGLLLGVCFVWPGGVVILGIDYVVRAIASLRLAGRQAASGARRFRLPDWRWAVMALLLAATVWAARSNWLVRWRFSGNRAAFEAAAAPLLMAATSAPAIEGCDLQRPWGAFIWCAKRVGDYDLRREAAFARDRVVFFETGGFFRSGWGFLYDPDGRADARLMHLEPMGEGWFGFYYAKE